MEMTKPARASNYDIMRDRMETQFAGYDQDAMIRKFGLKSDAGYIYLRFAARDYRINRTAGRVEWYCAARDEYVHADYSASMTIFDMLAWSRPGCALSGQFVPPGALDGVVQSSASSGIGIFSDQGKYFAGRCEELRRACLKLGGKSASASGDVAFVLPLFDFFPVMLQFWDADEEFGAVLKFMWDKNTTDFMHYETVAFATGHLIGRLKECMEDSAGRT